MLRAGTGGYVRVAFLPRLIGVGKKHRREAPLSHRALLSAFFTRWSFFIVKRLCVRPIVYTSSRRAIARPTLTSL